MCPPSSNTTMCSFDYRDWLLHLLLRLLSRKDQRRDISGELSALDLLISSALIGDGRMTSELDLKMLGTHVTTSSVGHKFTQLGRRVLIHTIVNTASLSITCQNTAKSYQNSV